MDENSIGIHDSTTILTHSSVQRILNDIKNHAVILGMNFSIDFLPSWFYDENEKRNVVEDLVEILKYFKFSERTVKRVKDNVVLVTLFNF